MKEQNKSLKLFISYSEKDEELKKQLMTHLSLLKRRNIIIIWDFCKIVAGTERENEIDKNIQQADIIILLISSDFMSSTHCYESELKTAMERHQSKQVLVIPVLLRPVRWQEASFSKLQAYPKNAKPVTSWANQDEAFEDVSQAISEVADELLDQRERDFQHKESCMAQYRKKLEEVLSAENVYSFDSISIPRKDTLNELQSELQLTDEEAKQLISSAFEPYKRYEKKLQRYKQTFLKVIQEEYPISQHNREALKQRQSDLGIKSEDVEIIELEVINNKVINANNKLPKEAARQKPLKIEEQQEKEHTKNLNEASQKTQKSNASVPENIFVETMNFINKNLSNFSNILSNNFEHFLENDKNAEENIFHNKLQRYEQEFLRVIKIEFPISDFTRNELKEFQHSLGLSEHNINPIEERIIIQAKTQEQKYYKEYIQNNKKIKWQCERTLPAHSARVRAIDINPEGTILVSGSDDKQIKIWDLKSGDLIRTLEGHSDWITDVSLSADNKILVSGSVDQKIIIWSTITGKQLKIISGHSDWVTAVKISQNKHIIASSSNDGIIQIWHSATGQHLKTIKDQTEFIRTLAIDECGQIIASSGSDKIIKLWSLENGSLKTFRGHSSFVRSLALSVDKNILASGSDDHTINVWNIKTGELLFNLKGHSNSVLSVVLSSDGTKLVSGSDDETIIIWDLSTGNVLEVLRGHSDSVTSVAINHSGTLITSGSRDSTIKIWR